MRRIDAESCSTHVLVCVNERPEGEACCSSVGGEAFYRRLKQKISEEGRVGTCWATRTKCLGFCNVKGTTVAVHARGQQSRWFAEVVESDLDLLWSEIVRK